LSPYANQDEINAKKDTPFSSMIPVQAMPSKTPHTHTQFNQPSQSSKKPTPTHVSTRNSAAATLLARNSTGANSHGANSHGAAPPTRPPPVFAHQF
jgi:hypothetical protein